MVAAASHAIPQYDCRPTTSSLAKQSAAAHNVQDVEASKEKKKLDFGQESHKFVGERKPYNHQAFPDVQMEATAGFECVVDDNANYLIRTPKGRCLNVNHFLMKVDYDYCQQNYHKCPAAMNAALYDGARHAAWVNLENQIDSVTFGLALPENTPIESFRKFTLMCIFRFLTKFQGRASTIHYAVNNLNRIVLKRLVKGQKITQQLYAGVAMACIRMAIKHEDTAAFNQLWQNPIRSLWKHAGFGKEIEDAVDLNEINQVEMDAMHVLQQPALTLPSPLDFLDRYLSVGGWPSKYTAEYRDLAHYLVDLSLFAPKMEGLAGARPSLLAAAALTLSIKIHNAMEKTEKYEFWPKRLEVLTNYPIKTLLPVMRDLSTLIRNKPSGVSV